MSQPKLDNSIDMLDEQTQFDDAIIWLRQSANRRWFASTQAKRERVYEALFRSNTRRNMFRGVYGSFAEAQASAPDNRQTGYDNPESAALYFGHMQADPYDYPVMLWLERSFATNLRTVFDVGGHIGIKYYAFKEHLKFPSDLAWRVCDVPAVVQRGQIAARKRDPSGQLQFTSDYAAVDGYDILFASGVVQYLPMTVKEWLEPIARKPKRIIFNTSAIHQTHSYFTLNSIGSAYCPYRVTAEANFIAQMTGLNYQLLDQWKTPGKGALHLPLNEEYSIQDYSGFVFDLQG
jgi:putative methyltransferase (TIGR04325 family)